MNILYLGKKSRISKYLNLENIERLITEDDINNIDFVISYGYRHILPENIVNKVNIVNLHISFLPFNRGADPIFWGFYEGKTQGITIHKMDKGIDTGDILLQKPMFPRKYDTLRTFYDYLSFEIENMFIYNCEKIIYNEIKPKKQTSKGTFHLKSQLDPIRDKLDYDTFITDFDKLRILFLNKK